MNDKEIDYQLAICDAFELAVCPTRKIMCVEEAQEMQVRVEEFRYAARTVFPQALRELKQALKEIGRLEALVQACEDSMNPEDVAAAGRSTEGA